MLLVFPYFFIVAVFSFPFLLCTPRMNRDGITCRSQVR